MSAALQFSVALFALFALLTAGYLVPVFRRGLAAGWGTVQARAVGTFEWVSRRLHALDTALIWTSRPFLTHAPGAYRRWAAFLLWYAGLYATAALAPRAVGLVALGWGLWGVLAINRAWVRNEKSRSKIAKKIDPAAAAADPLGAHEVGTPPADPEPAGIGKVNDAYAPTPPAGGERPIDLTARMLAVLRRTPDLRLMAFIASLQLVAIIPLMLVLAHGLFGAFDTPAEVTYAQSLWHIVETTYLKGTVDWLRPDLHTDVALVPAVAWVMPVIKFAIYVLLTLGVFRLLQIVEDIKEGILGVRQDPDMAVLLGKRAVPRLLAKVDDPEVPPAVRENALLALGRLGDGRAADALRRFAEDAAQPARVRAAAALALGYLAAPPAADPDGLRPAADPDRLAANGVVAAALARLLREDRCDIVREAAAIGLGLTDHPVAPAELLRRLEEVQRPKGGGRAVEAIPEVVKHLAQAVGERLGGGWPAGGPADRATVRRAVELILDYRGRDETSADPRDRTQGVHSLLRHRYLRVRNRAVRALAALGETDLALPALLAVLNENDNPKLLDVWAGVVGRLTAPLPADSPLRGRAVGELCRLIQRRKNGAVRRSAAAALGALARAHRDAVTTSAEGPLVAALGEAYRMDDKDVQDTLHAVLAGPFRAADRAEQAREENSFDFLADQVDVVTGEGDPAARVAAARKIRPLQDEGSLARLEALLARPDVPAELGGVLGPVVARMKEAVEAKGT